MTKTFFTLLGLIGIALILMSNDTGVASEAGKDRTGSPLNATGGLQCNACHTGGTFSTTISTQLKDTSGAVVTEYWPGNTYTYEVQVSSTGASKFGFQAIALTASNTNAGTLNVSSANSKIKVLSTSLRYGEHTAPSTSGLFVMTWIAPAVGTGTIKFYACGNGVNGDALKTGDKPSLKTEITITENPLASINETEKSLISVYPNPVSDQLNINPSFSGEAKLILVSMIGKVEIMKMVQFVKGSPYSIDASSFSSGTYFLNIVDENGKQLATSKFIKK